MNPLAIEQSRDNLQAMRDSLTILQSIADAQKTRIAWDQFLDGYYRIWQKLLEGSKDNTKHYAWYGRNVSIRRKDQLLTYVYQARNSVTHGLRELTEHREGHTRFGLPGESVSFGRLPGGGFYLLPRGNSGATLRVRGPGLYLVEVVSSEGDRFPVPSCHLGKDMPFDVPAEAAEAALEYMEKLVDSAAALT